VTSSGSTDDQSDGARSAVVKHSFNYEITNNDRLCEAAEAARLEKAFAL
jgi:hypothetical protein